MDELRRKQLAEIAELQNELVGNYNYTVSCRIMQYGIVQDAVNARLQSLEKQRARLGAEADGARIDADALAQQALQAEKRQRAHDKQVW